MGTRPLLSGLSCPFVTTPSPARDLPSVMSMSGQATEAWEIARLPWELLCGGVASAWENNALFF